VTFIFVKSTFDSQLYISPFALIAPLKIKIKSSPDYILDKNVRTAFFKDENKIYHTSISNILLMTKNDDSKV
jgi:hypothetical protein